MLSTEGAGSVKRHSIDHFDRELVSRDGQSYCDGCFPLEQSKIVVALLVFVPSNVLFHGSLKEFRL